MPNHKSKHLTIGHNCSEKQRLIEQLTATQAIILSQKPTNKIPLLVCSAPKTWILVDPDCDFEAKIAEYKAIHNPVKVVVNEVTKRHNKMKPIKTNG